MNIKPFSLLIKPTSADCNLRCEYCFYLDHCALYPDVKRHRMSDEVVEKMIRSYMSTMQHVYSFGWQGGEPTLMGLEFFKKVVQLQKKYARPGARVANGLQTNGTMIDDEFASFLAENNFLVGVSLDGPDEIHNRYRLNADGRGTHEDVVRGIEALKRNKVEFNILTLVNAANVTRGREVYRYLRDMGIFYHQYIPCVEFDDQGNKMPFAISGDQWGTFLCDIFDEWIQNDKQRVSVRLFDSILNLMVDGVYTTCHHAGNCSQYFVVEYNGDIYPCDFFVKRELKLGNITENSWSEMSSYGKYLQFGSQKNDWNEKCKECEYLNLCSGDCLKHRLYKGGNPRTLSWLCSGWKKFYDHSLPEFRNIAISAIKERQRNGMYRDNKPHKLFIDKSMGRNDTCFCGSGKKYKKCHGAG
jgi:uncharacterized protein